MRLILPFALDVAAQRYLPAEVGAADADAQGCDRWCIDLSLPGEGPSHWSADRIEQVARLCRELNVSPVLHGDFRAPYAADIPEIRNAALDYVRSEIELARQLGGPLILHGGCVVEPRPSHTARNAAFGRFLSVLAEVQDLASRSGVPLWLENLSHYPKFRPFSYVFTRYADFRTVTKEIPEMSFLFDVGHANVNQEFPVEVIEEFGNSIAAISFSANDGTADSHLGLHHGGVPLPLIVGALKQRDWHGHLIFETRGADVADGVALLGKLWEAC